MDIRQELLKEHSKACTDKIVGYVGVNQSRFNTLIAIFLNGSYQVTQRVAGPLACCVINHPFFIEGHYGVLLKMLDKPDIHDAVKRNIMRFLQFVEIPQKYQGIVVEHCFRLMEPKEPGCCAGFCYDRSR